MKTLVNVIALMALSVPAATLASSSSAQKTLKACFAPSLKAAYAQVRKLGYGDPEVDLSYCQARHDSKKSRDYFHCKGGAREGIDGFGGIEFTIDIWKDDCSERAFKKIPAKMQWEETKSKR